MIGSKLGGRYELTDELGRGGMGVVYRATDPVLRREVAVKMIPPSRLGQDAEKRFQHEARVVAQMDHPALVPIHDFGNHEGALFFVMPLVEGTPLRDLIQERNLTLGEILTIGIQVAEALEYSHARGIVHRDVKPGNIMISRGGNLRVRVMDFGLAYTIRQETTSDTSPVGTLFCASPEQVSGGPVDARSDIYSLGSVLYECLAGTPPFTGTAHGMVYRILHDPPLPLRNRGVDVEPELEKVVLACLAKEPSRRPQRAGDLAAALAHYRDHLAGGTAARQLAAAPPLITLPTDTPLRTPLVGRQAEMQELRSRLDTALGGECQLVLVGGETGSGKSRLLGELENLARARQIRVLHGRFADRESAIPYQGLCDLVQDYFRVRDPDSTQSRIPSSSSVGRPGHASHPDLSDLADELIAVFPTFSEIPQIRGAAAGPETPSGSAAPWPQSAKRSEDDGAEPSYIYELLARTLARLVQDRPVVLLLENLHTADMAIEALQYIVRRLGPTSTLIVASYLPDVVERSHPLSKMLRNATDDPRCAVLTLGPLQGEDFRRLVELTLGSKDFDNDLASRLREATEGNPFFLQELIRSLRESDALTRDQDGVWTLREAGFATGSLPASVQQVIEQRLERLPDDQHRILRTASVLGRRFAFRELEELVAATARDAPDLDEVVDALLELGILEEDRKSRGDYLSFTSGVVREVFYRELPRRRRRMLHRTFARQLEERHKDRLERFYPQLVHHFAAAAEAPETIRYGLELARRSLQSASPHDAIRAARTALEFAEDEYADEAVQPQVLGELHMLLGRAHRAVGQSQRAMTEAERAVTVFSQAELACESAEAAFLAAEMAWQGRRIDAARWWIERGLELARQDDAREPLVKLLTLGATLAHLRGEHQAAQRFLAEAEELQADPEDAEAKDTVHQGGHLYVSIPCAIPSLDPAQADVDEKYEIVSTLFETLLSTDVHGNPIPRLALRWEMQNKGRSFEVALRREACFADGRPLGARDVKASMERAARVATERILAIEALVGIEGFRDGTANDIRGIVAPPLTLADRDAPERILFYLKEPLPIFPTLLADPTTAIVRTANTVEDDIRCSDSDLVGTGPFRLRHHEADRIVLVPNKRYWRHDPSPLDRLELLKVRDGAAVVHRLRTGELDIGRDLPPRDLEDLLRDRLWHDGLVEATKRNTYFVLFNRDGPLTRLPEVRQALAGVVRVRDLVWQHLGRFAQPAVSLLPPGVLGHDPGRRRLQMPVDAARDILRQALGDGTHRIVVTLHPSLRDRYETLTRALLATWEELGVEVLVKTGSREEYVEQCVDSQGIDVMIGRWVADYADPDSFTYMVFHSGHGRCRGYLSTQKLDDLLERARGETDPERRQTLYRRFEERILEDNLLLPLFHDVDYRLAGPRVRGLKLSNTVPYVNYSRVAKAKDVTPPARRKRAEGGGEIHIPIGVALRDLDPSGEKLTDQMNVVSTIFETLTRFGEGAQVRPWLASSFEALDDGAAYRFKLRPGVRFHDDRLLSARDVRHSYERALRQQNNAVLFPLLPIRGARAVRDGAARELAGLHVMASDELIFELEEPLPFFPGLLAHPTTGIVPEGTQELGGPWDDGCVGTGPFRVVRWVAGERLDLERNPHYWRPSFPRSDRLSFHLGMTAERTVSELREGLLSFATELRPADIEALRRDPQHLAGYREAPRLATYFLALNAQRGPFQDAARRRAFADALNVGEAVRNSLGRLVNRAQGLIPPGLLGARTGRRGRDPQNEEFLSELAGLELSATLLPTYTNQYAGLWDLLKEQIETLGATVHVVASDAGNAVQAVLDGSADLALLRWVADYPDADAFVTGILHGSAGILARFCATPEIDRLCEQGRRESDPGVRQEIYREVESRLREEALLVPLFHEQNHFFCHPSLRGLRLNLSVPEVRYEELYLAR